MSPAAQRILYDTEGEEAVAGRRKEEGRVDRQTKDEIKRANIILEVGLKVMFIVLKSALVSV